MRLIIVSSLLSEFSKISLIQKLNHHWSMWNYNNTAVFEWFQATRYQKIASIAYLIRLFKCRNSKWKKICLIS